MAAAGYAYAIGADHQPEADALAAAKLILELSADVNAANDVGETALHGVGYTGWDSVGQLLLDNGAYVDARNIVGWTPLAIAQGYFDTTTMTKTVHPRVIVLLKKFGAEPTPPSHEQKRLRY
jgi:ankyrin repeat protein